jgi:hypothetical protein
LDSTVVLNEIMYNPAGAEETLEFVELYNQMTVDMDISGWSLADAVDYKFAEGTVVPTGQYLVVAKDPAALAKAAPLVQAIGPFGGQLSNDAERIELRDRNDRLMDFLEYDDDGQWPVAPDGSGASLAKLNPKSATGRAENWTSSMVIGGTPGQGNFPEQSEGGPGLLDAPVLAINETAGGSANEFWLELVNHGQEPINLAGYVVETSAGHRKVLDGPTLGPGQFHLLSASMLGFRASAGERIDLFSPNKSLALDAVRVLERLQGRVPDGTGPWLNPDRETPGQANVLQFRDEIVINEIFYHAPANPSSQGVPPTAVDTKLVPWDATWRRSVDFNFGAGDLPYNPGPNWDDAPHAVDNLKWFEGQGPLGFSARRTPERINRQLASPELATNFITTYYFETELGLTQEQIDSFDEIVLRHMVDDGAVFYINGEEVLRFNMPPGAADYSTLARAEIATATIEEVSLNVKGHLVALPGLNRVSVEVHQASVGSPDIVFGAELVGRAIIDPGLPPSPFEEDPEEWIELANRSASVVDLSGWTLDDAIQYEIPAGTRIAPGQYLVVAKDPQALAQKYPDIAARTIGGYAGELSDRTDRIVLTDARGNPADMVEYFQNGSWPWQADGGGSSLELRDPDSDNSSSLAWVASTPADDVPWKAYTYQGLAGRSSIGPDGQWEEFVVGLLDAGELLLDDISVVQDPAGQAIELIQNGTFQNDAIGAEAAKWRIIGNHRHSQVIVDPDNPNNKVLRFVATGPTEHMHNHAETTLKNGDQFVDIDRNAEYRISFRAKWIAGSNQLNSRLYFNRLPRTTLVERTSMFGTPGRQNSAYVENLGPTYHNLRHSPSVPQPNQPVTVGVRAQDQDGMAAATLWYSVAGGNWASTPMVEVGPTQYSGQIPGQAAGTIVQFYVQAHDRRGAVTEFPRDGARSRALVQIDDGRSETNGLHNLRLILTGADADFLHHELELMSNDPLPATVVYNESEVFYNVGIRLSGSQRARPFQPRLSFKVQFNTEQPFRGVHDSVILDRSESTGFGQRELIYFHGMNHAGGLPSEYDDLLHIITPRRAHTGSVLLQATRVSDVLLESQFENGAAGQLYEYELTYYPQTTIDRTPEGRKRPQPDGTNGVAITDLGDDKENYRWAFLIKNNRTADDYQRLIEFAKAMSLRGDAFNQTIGQFIDVDEWLRAFAFSVITGHGDNYGVDGSQHNLHLYIRPSDQKVLHLPHDFDAFFEATRALVGSGDLRKLLAVPENEHMYYGHVYDMLQTTFNEAYLKRWTEHFGSLLPRQRFDRHLADLVRRSSFLEQQIRRVAPEVPFAITSSDNPSVNSNQATITGTGWINVRELRLAGSSVPLAVQWTDVTAWQATVPLSRGQNELTIEAYDFQGNLLGTDAITVTTNVDNPVREALRITELNFNPYAMTSEELASGASLNNDDFEFIELVNTSNTPINLLGASFTDGVRFVFPEFQLAAGRSAVIVSNEHAFRLRYGNDSALIGVYEGHLSNGGEMLKLEDATGQAILEFSFRDDWYADADGRGYSLVAVDPSAALGSVDSWRPSIQIGGSPAVPEPFALAPGDANRDGVFDRRDVILVLQAGTYLGSGPATWAQGDWNGDGLFNQVDLVRALQAGNYR